MLQDYRSRRQEREKFKAGQRRRVIFKRIFLWLAFFVLTGGVVYAFVVLANRTEQKRLGETIPVMGREHITIGAVHPSYNSNPPTSGWHYGLEAEWGVYQEELPDEQLIHNLEHGGIWIAYKDVDAQTKAKLESLAAEYPASVILTPRLANDAAIAVASWGRLMKLENFEEQLIRDFISQNKNRSPEPLAR